MILASRKTYLKLSSNDLDLTKLEPKTVDHRQFLSNLQLGEIKAEIMLGCGGKPLIGLSSC
jgi:hypothetical protein